MTRADVILRPATLADVDVLTRWDSEPGVVAASGDDDVADWTTELASQSAWYEVLIAELNGRPIGVVQIIDPHHEVTHYWGEIETGLRAIDIWIGEPEARGHGHGTAMMRAALNRCFAPRDVTAVVIDPLESNHRARRFYERLGFVEVGPRQFGDDDCVVYRLERGDWEESSLRG